jgi:hypothetical protein
MGEGCTAAAEWTICAGPAPDNCTYACTAHVWELLMGSENRVFPVDAGESATTALCCYIEPKEEAAR